MFNNYEWSFPLGSFAFSTVSTNQSSNPKRWKGGDFRTQWKKKVWGTPFRLWWGPDGPHRGHPQGPHSGLPGGRPEGVFFLSVLFAHLFCKERGWNRHLLGCSDSTCVFKAEAETPSTPLSLLWFSFGFSFKHSNPSCLTGKDSNRSMSTAPTEIVY